MWWLVKIYSKVSRYFLTKKPKIINNRPHKWPYILFNVTAATTLLSAWFRTFSKYFLNTMKKQRNGHQNIRIILDYRTNLQCNMNILTVDKREMF